MNCQYSYIGFVYLEGFWTVGTEQNQKRLAAHQGNQPSAFLTILGLDQMRRAVSESRHVILSAPIEFCISTYVGRVGFGGE